VVAPAGIGAAAFALERVFYFICAGFSQGCIHPELQPIAPMILEALNFAATFAISPRRESSEINSSVRLWARARRCSRDWAAHEDNCWAFVRQVMEGLPQRRTVAVLGSGLLRDVPVMELSQSFRAVRLFDLQHLASVRTWAALRGLGNLSFENRDLSGLDEMLASPDRVPEPLSFLRDIPDLDLVISANLLSQIGVGLSRVVKGMPSAPADTIAPLMAAHVEGLGTAGAIACLLTDVAYEIRDRSGAVLEHDSLMHGIDLPEPDRQWQWTVAPSGELDPAYQAIHTVAAIKLPPAGPAPSLP
jgi:hypothetical protein